MYSVHTYICVLAEYKAPTVRLPPFAPIISLTSVEQQYIKKYNLDDLAYSSLYSFIITKDVMWMAPGGEKGHSSSPSTSPRPPRLPCGGLVV